MTKPTKPSSGPAKKGPAGNAAAAKSTAASRSARGGPAKVSAAKGGPAKGAPAAKDAPAAKGAATKAATKTATRTAPNRAQSKKIVNKRQTPWGLIATTVIVIVLAVGVVVYAVAQGNKKKTQADPGKIVGIQHYASLTRNHVAGVVKYPESPPVGGDHSPVWADCTGTVYPSQIANENAVHTLEHGAIWITYKPGLPADQLDALTKLVSGQQYTLLTPYAGLKSNVSLQAWGYQLFVDSATDPRVQQFITDLRLNQSNTPELGASCTNSAFKTTPSTPGHPTES
ncbi:MAG TPA: DUF3105 domain-containing protein [Jatrophihabitans sp.]|jgi:hypothetical protein